MPKLNKILIHRPLVFEIKINLISFFRRENRSKIRYTPKKCTTLTL